MTLQLVGSLVQSFAIANNANVSVVVPKGYMIFGVSFVESAGNAVTGGIKVGTTSGATDVIAAQAVGANAAVGVADASILIKMFSGTVDQTLFVQPVGSWNSAVVRCTFFLVRGIV